MDDRAGYGREWREWTPPPPFVTHRELNEITGEIGALKQSNAHILQTYTHIRGEMREGFERIERLMRAQEVQATNEGGGVNLTVRELVLLIVAIAAAAVILTYMFVTGHPDAAKGLAA